MGAAMKSTVSRKIKITGIGVSIPEKILTNADLEKMVDTSDEWIVTRTGIKERRIARPDQAASDLGIEAARDALKDAGLEIGDIDLIVTATDSPDMIFPSTACLIQKGLGGNPLPAFDMIAGCSGALYALIVAEGMVMSGAAKRVLVIGTEALSRLTDWEDRSTCVLFGDAAGAFVVEESTDESGMLSHYWKSEGGLGDLISLPGGGSRIPATHKSVDDREHFIHMKGNETFKHAVKRMGEAALAVLKQAGLKKEDIAYFIPHQANLRIIHALAKRLKIPMSKVFVNVQKYGNMSAASTAVALVEAVQEGHVKKGDKVLLVAFGAGLTWASCVIQW
jgi:3-oxoacyl-[acyl-carrier-protein] synthase III